MFCKKFFPKIKKLIASCDKFLIENVDLAITVTNHIKRVLGSEPVGILVSLTPFKWDDVARASAETALEFALKKLGKIKDTLNQPQLRDFLEWLKEQPEPIQDAYLQKLASLQAQYLDNMRHSGSTYDTITQARYLENKKTVNS